MKKLFVSLTLLIGIIAPGVVALPSVIYAADSKDIVCEGIGLIGSNGTCSQVESEPTVERIIRTVISILSYVVGIAAIIMIVISGLKYVTSNGDSSKIKSAKDTIIYALIGLVVAAIAQVLVQYVLTKATTDPAVKPETNSGGGPPKNAD